MQKLKTMISQIVNDVLFRKMLNACVYMEVWEYMCVILFLYFYFLKSKI